MKRMGIYDYSILLIGIVALLHQYLQKQLDWHLPFLHAYLDDVLCIPLFLALWNWERQHLWKQHMITEREIVSFVFFIFVVFEGVIPLFTPHFTADWWDGIAYGAGGILFGGLQRSREVENSSQETEDRSSDTMHRVSTVQHKNRQVRRKRKRPQRDQISAARSTAGGSTTQGRVQPGMGGP